MKKQGTMKKVLSILLCLCMVLQYVPATVFAAAEDNLCEHHAVHTEECGYEEGVSDCTYHCDVCLGHDHGDEEEEPEPSEEPAPLRQLVTGEVPGVEAALNETETRLIYADFATTGFAHEWTFRVWASENQELPCEEIKIVDSFQIYRIPVDAKYCTVEASDDRYSIPLTELPADKDTVLVWNDLKASYINFTCNHWITTEDGYECDTCGACMETGEEHKYENGSCACGKACSHSWINSVCTICGAKCAHTGGDELTCMGYKCELCQNWYGVGTNDNHLKIGACDCGLTTYPVWVNGAQVTSADKDFVGGLTYITYDPDENLLYLGGNFGDPYEENDAVKVVGDITVCLNNSFEIFGNINVSGKLTIQGQGKMTVSGGSYGIKAQNVTVGDSVHLLITGKQAVDAGSVTGNGTCRTSADEKFGDFAAPGNGGYYEFIGSSLCNHEAKPDCTDTCPVCNTSGLPVNGNHSTDDESAEATCQGYQCVKCGQYFGDKDESKHVTEMEGNKATCQKRAVCDLCGESYGVVDPDKHTFGADSKCTRCGETCAHESYTDGKCTICGAACEHKDCTNGICDVCGALSEKAVASVSKDGVLTGGYETLQAAFDAVKDCTENDKAVLTVLQDIDLGSDYATVNYGVFTLDLNGHKITSSSYTCAISISKRVTLDVTICDGVGGGIVENTNQYSGSAVYVYDGTMNITGGTYRGYEGIKLSGGTVYFGGTAEVVGKWLCISVRGGDLYLTGGKLSSTSTSSANNLIYTSDGTATITGGTFQADANVADIYRSISSTTPGTVILTLAEGEDTGAYFPGGLRVKETTLKNVLGEGASYWQESGYVYVTDTQQEIAGDVTIKKACEHSYGTDSMCTICGAACTHESYTDGVCDGCGTPCEHDFENGKCKVCQMECTEHEMDNGFCALCGTYEAAPYNDQNKVYEISNAGQLYWYAEQFNKNGNVGSAMLMKDIVINENVLVGGSLSSNAGSFRKWIPIGSQSNHFTYNFDGNNHTISGLYYNDASNADAEAYIGLIGYLDAGTVKNVGVIDSYINGGQYTSAVAGIIFRNAKATNCWSNSVVTSAEEYAAVGGVIGCVNGSSITDCHNSGSVSGTGSVGGVVGVTAIGGTGNPDPSLTRCYNTGNVSSGTSGKQVYVGGVLGHGNQKATIDNCYNTGSVSCTGSSASVGGLVGRNFKSNLKNSYNTGTVTGAEDAKVGGLLGKNEGSSTATNCYFNSVKFSGNAVGSNASLLADTAAKSAAAFASGEVAYLLQGEQSTQVWGQTCGTGLPALGGKTVYYGYTSCDATEKVYTNQVVGAERPDHTGNATVTPLNNGTHTVTYDCCGTSVTENCSGGEATCQVRATCTVCGKSYGELGNHDWSKGNFCSECGRPQKLYLHYPYENWDALEYTSYSWNYSQKYYPAIGPGDFTTKYPYYKNLLIIDLDVNENTIWLCRNNLYDGPVYTSFSIEANKDYYVISGTSVESSGGVFCPHTSWTDGVCDNCKKECAHKYVNGVCTLCSKVCGHNYIKGQCYTCNARCDSHQLDDNGCCTVCDMRKIYLVVKDWDSCTLTYQYVDGSGVTRTEWGTSSYKDAEDRYWNYVPKSAIDVCFYYEEWDRELLEPEITEHQTGNLKLPGADKNCYYVGTDWTESYEGSWTYYTYTGKWATYPCEHNYSSETGKCTTCGIPCDHQIGESGWCPCGMACGMQVENLSWYYLNGTLTVSGEGDMVENLGFSGLFNLLDVKTIVIEDDVASISAWAFSSMRNATSVSVGETVTSIGDYAFAYCTSLESVALPDGLTTIGKFAFVECDALTEITIPAGVQEIGIMAFGYCDSLETVTFEQGFKGEVANQAFFQFDGTAYVPCNWKHGKNPFGDGVTLNMPLHKVDENSICEVCGETCNHENIVSGKCADCGIDCPHAGGTAATCISRAYCPKCGYYGAVDLSHHVYGCEIMSTQNEGPDTHKRAYSSCGTVVAEAEPCSGGNATCMEQAFCDVCHEYYGQLAECEMDPINGYCIYGCGTEMAVAYIWGEGEGAEDTYFETLADAANAANENDTIVLIADVTEDVNFPVYVNLELGEYSIEGDITIQDQEARIVNGKLYLYGGELNNTGNYIEVYGDTKPTYWNAGEGYAIYEGNGRLKLNNATISYTGDGNGAYYTIRSMNDLTIEFVGENNVYCSSPEECVAILTHGNGNTPRDLTLVGEKNAVLNITTGDSNNVKGIRSQNLNVVSGTVNIVAGKAKYSRAIIARNNVTISEGAAVNASAGDAGNNGDSSIALETDKILTVNGTLNATFGTAPANNYSTGIYASKVIIDPDSGSINGLVKLVEYTASESFGEYKSYYTVCGDTVLKANLTAYSYEGETYADIVIFTVPVGTSLTVNEGVTLDLSAVKLEDIDFSGTIINNGTIILPAGFDPMDAPEGGNVTVGDKAYTWDSENDKWICAEGSHLGGTATCTTLAICDMCGTGYGEVNLNYHADNEVVFLDNGDDTHSGYCSACDAPLSDYQGQSHGYDSVTHLCVCQLAEVFTATFDANGGMWNDGSYEKAVNVSFGSAIEAPEDPTKYNHIFEGWTPTVGVMDTEGKTFTAQWKPVDFTLSFYLSQEDTTPVATFQVPYLTELTIWDEVGDDEYEFQGASDYLKDLIAQIDESKLTKEHYTFDAWDLEESLECMWRDHSIYAIMQPKAYAITWDFAGGELVQTFDGAPEVGYYGKNFSIEFWDADIPVKRDGYRFSHFIDQNGDRYDPRVGGFDDIHYWYVGKMPGYDLQLTAVWECLHQSTKAVDHGDGTHNLVCTEVDCNGYVVTANVPHGEFNYTSSGNAITALCGQCNAVAGRVTITAMSKDYDGMPVEATVVATGIFKDEAIDVYYTIGEFGLLGNPRNAGTYTAKIALYGEEATTEFTIRRVPASVEKAPVAEKLTYNGDVQSLVTAGTTEQGKLVYSLEENGEYAETIPTAKNAGAYTVWYYVQGEGNYIDSSKASVSVTLEKAESSVTKAPAAVAGLTYNGKVQTLITAGAAQGGTMMYKLGDGQWSTEIPEAKAEGTYQVSYKVVGDENHKDVAEKTIAVTMAECVHTGGNATCVEKAICSKCGDIYGNFGGHTYGNLIPSTAAIHNQTQLKGAVAAHYQCSLCSKYFTESKTETTMEKLTGKAPEHNFSDWVNTDKNQHWKKCSCGLTSEKTNHNFVTEIEGTKTPATCMATGSVTMKCECGATTVKTLPIDKTNHTKKNTTVKNAVAATCGKAGYTGDTYCECGNKILTGKAIAATGKHVYDNNQDGTCNACAVNRANVEIRQVVDMYRMYNPNTGEHFYTGSQVEKNDLIAAGWNYEGIAFSFSANSGAPVHRLYDPASGEHLYTMDEAEKSRLMAAGWNYEGVAFNSAYDTEAVQHRLYNPNATVGAYHFTFSVEEKQNLLDAGWVYQGIGWYSCWY